MTDTLDNSILSLQKMCEEIEKLLYPLYKLVKNNDSCASVSCHTEYCPICKENTICDLIHIAIIYSTVNMCKKCLKDKYNIDIVNTLYDKIQLEFIKLYESGKNKIKLDEDLFEIDCEPCEIIFRFLNDKIKIFVTIKKNNKIKNILFSNYLIWNS